MQLRKHNVIYFKKFKQILSHAKHILEFRTCQDLKEEYDKSKMFILGHTV